MTAKWPILGDRQMGRFPWLLTGRVEVRTYISMDASELPSTEEWMGLKSVGKVMRERTLKGKTSTEIQYYISSCEIDVRRQRRWRVDDNGMAGSIGRQRQLGWRVPSPADDSLMAASIASQRQPDGGSHRLSTTRGWRLFRPINLI